jgi:hypothetical protein
MPFADPEVKRAYNREYGNRHAEARKVRCRTWYGRNKERARANNRRWKRENRERYNRQQVARKRERLYGLSSEAFDALLAAQHGVCAICGRGPNGKAWNVDHDHATGVVRGILCLKCNTLLGMAEDSTDRLMAAIRYLEAPPARSVN